MPPRYRRGRYFFGADPRIITAVPGAAVHIIENGVNGTAAHKAEDPAELIQFVR